ncbi:MAG: bifunctional 5,10-methylenetetrahydrofolate dehydrogenase/5,10-methenyltetrahydrofolate cyclohydrolase [Elusimicrobiota bacterium]|nr:MAG: bifunctional 5,10-methylenetetrahydrofolate dehydrogenase/5,10-methenyltetrahydrofolate cyclohydrolase [Elusimicrobiota bacterium]
MTTRALDCRGTAARYFDWVAREVAGMRKKPRLATVLFRPKQNPASLQYRDLMLRDAARLGVPVDGHEAEDEESLLALVRRLNADRSTSGLMLFYPLACALKDEDVMDLVSAAKDVEGLNSTNLGYLIKYKRFVDEARGIKCVVPATAKAVVKTLQAYPEIPLEGAFAVVVNNSMRVGKPLGLMLENLGATVVKCYDKTPKALLEEQVRRADLVVTAVPDPSFKLDASWIKPGAAVVDVSYQGNVDAKALEGRASFLTAPDNRIGAMTRAMTFVNLVYCARNVPARRPRAGSVG